jgi:tetratricopeptide (TPR) repeat protein
MNFRTYCQFLLVLSSLAVSVSVYCPAVLGQESALEAAAAKSTDPALGEILAKAVTAYGGEEAIAKLGANITVVGHELSAENTNVKEGRVFRLLRMGYKWRLDHEASEADASGANNFAAGFALSEGFNGEPWVSQGKRSQELNFHTAKLLNLESTAPGSLLLEAQRSLSFADSPMKVENLGEENYAGQLVWVLQFKSKESNDSFKIYLDKRNFMLVALSFADSDGDGKPRSVILEYLENRPVLGSMYPFKQVRKINGIVDLQRLIDDVSNPPVKDMEFDRPGGIQHLMHSVEVPFDYAHKEILVKCRINQGDELDFLFDTGASETIIDRRVAAENMLLKEGVADIRALAGSVQSDTTTLGRFEVGNLVLNDVDARILDLSGQSRHLGRRLGGIIGTNVISKFVAVLDYGKSKITFHDADTFVRPTDVVALPFARKSAPVIKVKLNGAFEQLMLVDTGAAFNNLPPQVALRFAGEAASKYTTEGTGLDGRPVKLGRVVLDSVSLGNRTCAKVDFTYSMLPNGAGKGKDDQGFFQSANLGILGNPFLENFQVVVDYKFQRLLFKSSPVLKSKSELDAAFSLGDRELVQKRDFRQAEFAYNRALLLATGSGDRKNEARAYGRLGNLKRLMAKDLNRPEHAKASWEYYVKGQELAKKLGACDIEGRVLSDWSLLYLDQGQTLSAKQTIDRAFLLAPNDANVNVNYAVHLSKGHRFSEMQRYLDRALFLEPSNWSALWYQLKLAETLSDSRKAAVTLKEILRHYPWSKTAQEKLHALESVPVGPAPIVVPTGPGARPLR